LTLREAKTVLTLLNVTGMMDFSSNSKFSFNLTAGVEVDASEQLTA